MHMSRLLLPCLRSGTLLFMKTRSQPREPMRTQLRGVLGDAEQRAIEDAGRVAREVAAIGATPRVTRS